MGIPSHTRIILMTEGQEHSREYGITRSMVVTLVLLALAILVILVLLLLSFGAKHNERLIIADLEAELAQARVAVAGVEQLREELQYMQGFQEKLLFMLGVQEAPPVNSDSLAVWMENGPVSAGEALRRSASLSLSPKPDRWPVGGLVTKEFQKGAANKGIRPHQGINITGTTDTPIHAAGGGRVVRTGNDEFLGNFVEIQHGLGYVTVYGHCSRLTVGIDDRVDAGQIIAYVGQSGQATAPHLHFEVYVQGEAIDPRKILEGDPPTN